MSELESKNQPMPRALAVLLCLQMVFLAALYFKLNAIQGNLLHLSQNGAGGGGAVEAVVPEVTAGSGPSKGNPQAPVEIVAFSDFGCSACRSAQPVLAEMLEKRGDSVRLTYRHFPLRSPGPPLDAAVAAQCAHEQGAFWPMYEQLFDPRHSFDRATFEALAEDLRLDGKAFRRCLEAPASVARVEEDKAAGLRWGVSGTPTLFINGRRIRGVPSIGVLERLVEEIRQADSITSAGG